MSVNSYRDSVQRLHKEILRLDEQINQETDKQLRSSSEANRMLGNLSGSNLTISTLTSKMRDVQRKQEEAKNYQKRVIVLQRQKTSKTEELNRAIKNLENAERSERQQQEQQNKKRRDEELQHIRNLTRELERQRGIQREIGNSRFTIDLTKLPDKIKILFLASNPNDSTLLQLDEEVREIGLKLRATEHRDAIEFVTRWAVRTEDLLQILNEVNPVIVHFSGHGDESGNLYFKKNDGCGKPVRPETISATLTTISESVKLVVFNACFSDLQAAMIADSLPAAIGMAAAVRDDAARIFAAQFYSSLGFGHSLQKAFDQGMAALQLADIDDVHIPQLITGSDVDPNEMILVRP